ncbi:hypothetical protein ACFSN5_10055 [Streptococcus tangpeifui]|nr:MULTISPECIES: hypothetical protein [unclassified Streptococcus]
MAIVAGLTASHCAPRVSFKVGILDEFLPASFYDENEKNVMNSPDSK